MTDQYSNNTYINHFRALGDPLDHGEIDEEPGADQAEPHLVQHSAVSTEQLQAAPTVQLTPLPKLSTSELMSSVSRYQKYAAIMHFGSAY